MSDALDGKVVTKISSHSKKINDVKFHPHFDSQKVFFSASADSSVKVWKESSAASGRSQAKYSEIASFQCSPDDDGFGVSSIAIHPLGDYLVAFAADGSWSFLDVNRNTIQCKINAPAGSPSADGYLSGSLHPDGLIIGAGTESGVVRIWDVRAQQNVGNCDASSPDSGGASGGVKSLSFSENGYLLAAGYSGGVVKLWDLRKLKCSKLYQVPDQHEVNAVAFDYSGVYLGVAAGNSVSAIVVKEWPEVSLNLPAAHSKPVTSIAWGRDAARIVSASLDRTVRVFGK